MSEDNVVRMPSVRAVPGGGNGGNSDLDARLRAVELDVREIKTILAGEIKTKLDQTATKRDIDRLKLWAAVGCLVGTIAVIGWLVRLLSTVPAPPP